MCGKFQICRHPITFLLHILCSSIKGKPIALCVLKELSGGISPMDCDQRVYYGAMCYGAKKEERMESLGMEGLQVVLKCHERSF
ncbi:uncharacterized [Tachysurus ichikawai]